MSSDLALDVAFCNVLTLIPNLFAASEAKFNFDYSAREVHAQRHNR
jgi:hypothetical protein